jgi:putative protease
VGDYSLNAANEIAAALLLESGLARLTPSLDLTWEQVAEMLAFIPAALLEPLVYQHVPLFHMEHCLFAANLSSGANPGNCGRPCGRLAMRLRDRNGEEHPVRADAACRNTVFCSRAQSSEKLIPAMVRAGVRQVRIELVDESSDETQRLLEMFRTILG